MTSARINVLEAVSHPEGNRVDIRWLNPAPGTYTGVRVVRREYSHPVSQDDGVIVAEVTDTVLFSLTGDFSADLDQGIFSTELKGLFSTWWSEPPESVMVEVITPGVTWRIYSAYESFLIQGADVYGMNLAEDTGLRTETVYYYTLFPFSGNPEVYEYHVGNRVSALAAGAYDFAGRMYRQLPMLYHRYDTSGQVKRFLELPGAQLDRFYSYASALLNVHDIQRVDGNLLPLLAQWIGWETDFNLGIEGQRNDIRGATAFYQTTGTVPNLEAAVGRTTGSWGIRTKEFVHNIFRSNQPERMGLWICQQDNNSDWIEPGELLSADEAFDGRASAARDSGNTLWLFYHTRRGRRWQIMAKTRKDGEEWTPSQWFAGAGADGCMDKDPVAVLQDKTLWVFWNHYEPASDRWTIHYRQLSEGQWTEIAVLDDIIPGGGGSKENPRAVVDRNNRLWLFWRERVNGRYRLIYQRHDNNKWEDDPPEEFPDDGGENPRVDEAPFVLYYSFYAMVQQDYILVCWNRKRAIPGGGRGCHETVFRKKTGIDKIKTGWGTVETLPKDPLARDYHDADPAAVYEGPGRIRLYWSSTRDSGWRLWQIKLEDIAGAGLDTAEPVLQDTYSNRAPLPLSIEGTASLVYRSNRNIRSGDFRRAGSTTPDARNSGKTALAGQYEDFQTYTYDSRRNTNMSGNYRYNRNAIGFYLDPDTGEQQEIDEKLEAVKGFLKRFLPIQTRAVFYMEEE
jgi:phage tail-like protein